MFFFRGGSCGDKIAYTRTRAIFKKIQKKLVTRTASKKSQKTKMEGKLSSLYILLPLVILFIVINELRMNKCCLMLSAFYMFLDIGYLGKTHLHLFHKKVMKNQLKHPLM